MLKCSLQKKSREESSGQGSGVEILVNEPYVNGPGGTSGQYTRKLYHVGRHLPGMPFSFANFLYHCLRRYFWHKIVKFAQNMLNNWIPLYAFYVPFNFSFLLIIYFLK